MFSTSLFAFSADTGILCHLRCSRVFRLASPWSSSRSRSLLGSVPKLPACTDVSYTLQPLKQQPASMFLQCNRTHMSSAAICYRMGKPHIGKMGKKNKKPACRLLKDFCIQKYLLCKKWLLRSQKFCVIWYFMQQLFPCERTGVLLLESKVSYLVFNWYISWHQIQALFFECVCIYLAKKRLPVSCQFDPWFNSDCPLFIYWWQRSS